MTYSISALRPSTNTFGMRAILSFFDEREPVTFSHRLATPCDLPALTELMTAAIDELQKGFLSADQIAASRAIMGLDTQLIDDGTYFVVEAGPVLAGCGGWSRRNTLYGGDHTA